MKKYFAIDIGSNTMLMSVAQKFKPDTPDISDASAKHHAEISEKNHTDIPEKSAPSDSKNAQTHWQKNEWHYTDFFRFASLAKDMDSARKIAPERLQVGLDILREYQKIIDRENKNHEVYVCATATSAIREAQNQEEVIAAMEKIFSTPINVIGGEKEGELTFLGSASHIQNPVAVIDVGGGSSEIILACGKKCQKIISLPIGVVRWKDRYSRDILANADQQENIIREIVDYLKKTWSENEKDLFKAMQGCTLYAVAGVATTLCAVHYGCALSDFERLEEKTLSLNAISDLRRGICALSPQQLQNDQKKFAVIDENRAEIMGISSLIFEAILSFLCEKFQAQPRVSISVRGLRYGLLHLMQQRIADAHGLKITHKKAKNYS